MPKPTSSTRLVAAILASGALTGGAAGTAQAAGASRDRQSGTAPDLVGRSMRTFSDPTPITSAWLPLSAHREAVLVGDSDSASRLRIVQTVPGHTKAFLVEGRLVRALAVEERTSEDGILRDVSVAYYAQADDRSVFQLGRDAYRAGGTGHRGASFLTPGRSERELRVAMPTVPREGSTLATTGQRVVDANARLSVAGGPFNRVLVLHTPATADQASEVHYHARGIGLLEAQTASGAVELAHLR